MPRKFTKKSRATRKAKKYVRKHMLRKGAKVHKNSATLVSRPGGGIVRQPFPPNLFTTLTYSASYTPMAQTVSGTPIYRQFRLNSLYDPDLTGVGKQPRYTDTLLGADNTTAPYSNYRVYAAAVKAVFYPSSTNATNSNGIVALIPKRSSVGAAATYEEILERPYAKSHFMNTLYVKPQTLKLFVKMKTHLGHKDLQDVDDSAAAYNGNPNEEVWLDVMASAIDASTGLMAVAFSITITYYVQLYTLNDVADS